MDFQEQGLQHLECCLCQGREYFAPIQVYSVLWQCEHPIQSESKKKKKKKNTHRILQRDINHLMQILGTTQTTSVRSCSYPMLRSLRSKAV